MNRLRLGLLTVVYMWHTTNTRLIGQKVVNHDKFFPQSYRLFLSLCFHSGRAFLASFSRVDSSCVVETFTKEGCVACLASHLHILNCIISLPCGL